MHSSCLPTQAADGLCWSWYSKMFTWTTSGTLVYCICRRTNLGYCSELGWRTSSNWACLSRISFCFCPRHPNCPKKATTRSIVTISSLFQQVRVLVPKSFHLLPPVAPYVTHLPCGAVVVVLPTQDTPHLLKRARFFMMRDSNSVFVPLHVFSAQLHVGYLVTLVFTACVYSFEITFRLFTTIRMQHSSEKPGLWPIRLF